MKKITNNLKCEFPSYSKNESVSRSLLSAFITGLDPTVCELADLKCALSEAVTNSTVHAYKDTIGKIKITMTSYEDRTVKIEIRDYGKGIEDIDKAMEPLYTTDRENERSGMGFTVMQSFTDKITVKSKKNKGTKVVLIKKLSPM